MIRRALAITALLIVVQPITTSAQSTPQELASDCNEQTILNNPMDSEGGFVKTDDGHLYKINEVDRVESQFWITGDDIMVCWARYRYNGSYVTLYTIHRKDDKADAERLH